MSPWTSILEDGLIFSLHIYTHLSHFMHQHSLKLFASQHFVIINSISTVILFIIQNVVNNNVSEIEPNH